MRRTLPFACLLLGVLVAGGCGKSSDTETETAQKTAEQEPKMRTRAKFKAPGHIQSTGGTELTPATIEYLRRLQKQHNVWRDETWPGEGGVLGNDYFEAWYPEGTAMVTHAMRVINDMMLARAKFDSIYGGAPEEKLVVLLAPYLDVYKDWTGRDFWFYSEIRSDTMTIQPISILLRRGLIDIAIPHEYFQWAIGRTTNFGAPRWVEEGVASYYTDEGKILGNQIYEFPEEARDMSPEQVEQALVGEETKQDARIGYYHAHRMVVALIERFGEDKLIAAINLMGEGYTMDDACRQTYGMSYEEILDLVSSSSAG